MMLHLLVWFLSFTKAESGRIGKLSKHSTNVSHPTEYLNLNGIASIFSPRMDFDQWKPLTGRGDPLRNDPTYDYEPPVLERVHYWADEIHSQREKYPDKKSEVLVLGVSSRKPSAASRPVAPIRRLPSLPIFPSKYEDFSYKFSDHYPMTILVPPPPPPPSHQHSHFVEDKLLLHTTPSKLLDTTVVFKDTTTKPEILSSFAIQESNLIYQSSTTEQNWFNNYNKTTNLPNNTVSSDYAGWGPTTPFDDINEAHNIISDTDNYNYDITKQPLSYYKPVLSEAPPPPPQASSHFIELPLFLPTVLPPTLLTASNTDTTWQATETTADMSTEAISRYIETTTEKVNNLPSQPTQESLSQIKPNVIDMLGPMISMPMVTDPNRPEDNLYAHASDSIHIYKSPPTEDSVNLEVMQTMQPPPPIKLPESSTPPSRKQFQFNPHILNNLLNEKPITHTHDPYLHMRFTTPIPTTLKMSQDNKSTTEAPSIPSYLIIQGHSKVKTYGSKPKPDNSVTQQEVSNPNETNEVKHLHPLKDKDTKKSEKNRVNRVSRAQNLKSLIDIGFGSIEIQETDLGIKYDVSDGSEVPVEIYKKGIIIDSDENNYSNRKQEEKRNKRETKILNGMFKNRTNKYIRNKINSSQTASNNNKGFSFFDNMYGD
ncbi:unnamed protein product [Euphydryas editha]|uniref:Uncharacterized protein n=1 Tax=Euphydryas editha TaxID=104508 RepID=A0AAU9VC08_EUPED|nr:unnamed protein product [Euphydryas editha]